MEIMYTLCELQKPSAIIVCCCILVAASVGLDTDRMLPDMLPVSELINMWQQIREATNLRGLPQDISFQLCCWFYPLLSIQAKAICTGCAVFFGRRSDDGLGLGMFK